MRLTKNWTDSERSLAVSQWPEEALGQTFDNMPDLCQDVFYHIIVKSIGGFGMKFKLEGYETPGLQAIKPTQGSLNHCER